jgi:hypothetical protein
MTEDAGSIEELAQSVRIALESGDLTAYSDLLDPAVHWGPPGDTSPPCQNRDQVLAWYERGRKKGVRATVSELEVIGDRILVGLLLTAGGQAAGGDRAGPWQLLAIKNGRIVDIIGFDERDEALEWGERSAL